LEVTHKKTALFGGLFIFSPHLNTISTKCLVLTPNLQGSLASSIFIIKQRWGVEIS